MTSSRHPTAVSTIDNGQLEQLADALRGGFDAGEQVAVEPHVSDLREILPLCFYPEESDALLRDADFLEGFQFYGLIGL